MTPLVSIITPCGPRHAEHVKLAAASVAWQSLADRCEMIIACDGGADVAPIEGATILPSDGIRRGPAHTRNRALASARGAFTLPLDADDYLLPRAVEHLLREYARGDFGYIYGDAYTLERDGRYMLRPAPEYVQRTYTDPATGQKYGGMDVFNIHVVTALTPTHLWRKVGGWDEQIDAWEDWSGHLRLAIAGVCGHRLPMPVFCYRVYEGDRMTQFYGGSPDLMENVLKRYRNDKGVIEMAGCCGGDKKLAAAALDAVLSAPFPNAAVMQDDKVRVEYLGTEKGSQTWEYPDRHSAIRLGNNAIDRYKDVTRDQAEWLLAHGIPVRIIPVFDGPEPPTVARPGDRAQALRPRAK